MEPGCQGSQWPESGWNLWFKIGKTSSKLSLKLKHRNCLWFFWEKNLKTNGLSMCVVIFRMKIAIKWGISNTEFIGQTYWWQMQHRNGRMQKLTILRLPETGSDIDYLIVTIQPDFPYWGNHKTCTLSSSVITTHSDQLNRNSELWSIAQTQSSVSKGFKFAKVTAKHGMPQPCSVRVNRRLQHTCNRRSVGTLIRKLPDSWILRTEFNVPSCVFLKNQPFYIMYIIALDPVQTYNLPRQHWGMSCEGIRLNHAIRQCRCNVKVLGFHFMHLFARYACCFLVGFIVSYEATSMRHCNWLMSINTGS